MTVYADTSFLVSIYVEDRHSAAADRLFVSGLRIWLTALHVAEFTHAIAQQVFRRQMSKAEAEGVSRKLQEDCSSGVWLGTSIPVNTFELCADLARRHGAKLGVRTLDSLHVACALGLKAEQFWTFDERQAKLANAEGLRGS